MDQTKLYRDIAERCGGDIYLGVVGPMRTGKSTFIKRFMELLVLPNLKGGERERTLDDLPQSGAGKTVMTTQPRFVPNDAAEVALADATARVRLIDSVGYPIPGALGMNEGEESRMVRTPWFDHDIPFEEAADIGTRRVIQDHATLGVVVTTDGSVVELPRSAYTEAEERTVRELQSLGKPFVVLLNSAHPDDGSTRRLRTELEEKYAVPVMASDVANLQSEDLNSLLERMLGEFPIREIRIHAPSWLTSLDEDHWLGKPIFDAVRTAAADIHRMRDADALRRVLSDIDSTEDVLAGEIDLNTGTAEYRLTMKDGLFYRILGEACGQPIDGEEHLFELMKELVHAKKEYDRVADALDSVRRTGYGMVAPAMDELELREPEIVRQGSRFGVRLRANAPSLHMIRVDIQTEVSPIVGTEQQSEELMQSMLSAFEIDRASLWDTEIFGKSLNELVREGLSSKLSKMPDDVQEKLQTAMQKIINEGNGGMICILL